MTHQSEGKWQAKDAPISKSVFDEAEKKRGKHGIVRIENDVAAIE